jgi:hypothetical protein
VGRGRKGMQSFAIWSQLGLQDLEKIMDTAGSGEPGILPEPKGFARYVCTATCPAYLTYYTC